jgi:hypothetical protein
MGEACEGTLPRLSLGNVCPEAGLVAWVPRGPVAPAKEIGPDGPRQGVLGHLLGPQTLRMGHQQPPLEHELGNHEGGQPPE